jgi:hypothetical protein
MVPHLNRQLQTLQTKNWWNSICRVLGQTPQLSGLLLSARLVKRVRLFPLQHFCVASSQIECAKSLLDRSSTSPWSRRTTRTDNAPKSLGGL